MSGSTCPVGLAHGAPFDQDDPQRDNPCDYRRTLKDAAAQKRCAR
jgi:hypothetical protein